MATVISTMSVELSLDASGFNRQMEAVGAKLTETGRRVRDIGTTLTTRVTAPIVAGFSVAVWAASDLNETMNKTNVVFGEAADSVVAWSEDSATAFGLSQNEALGMASTFGNIFTGMGMGGEAAAELSTQFVQLGADLGSFNNVPTAEALDAIRAGVMGEYEPLRRFGIVLTEAEVNARALEMGLVDANGEVTEAGKVAARTALIQEKSANAQGDFANTSGSLANQMKILRARITNMAASIGQVLLPYVTRIVGWLAQWADKFTTLSDRSRKIVVVVGLIVAAIGPLLVAIGTAAVVAGSVAKNFGTIVKVMKAVRMATMSALGPFLLIVAVLAALYFIWTRDLFGIRTKITKWFDAFKAPGGGLDKLKLKFEQLKASVIRFWFQIRPILENFKRAVIDAFGRAVEFIRDNLYRLEPVFAALLVVIGRFVELVRAVFSGDLGEIWDKFKALVGSLAELAHSIGAMLWDAIKDAVRAVNWGAIWDWVKAGVGALTDWALDVALPAIGGKLGEWAGTLWDWIKQGAAWIADTGVDVAKDWLVSFGTWVLSLDWPGLAGGIVDKASSLWDWLKEKAAWLAQTGADVAAAWLISFGDWVLSLDWPEIAGGIVDKASSAWDWIKTKVAWLTQTGADVAKEWIASFGDWALSLDVPAISGGIVDNVKSFWGWVADKVSWLAGFIDADSITKALGDIEFSIDLPKLAGKIVDGYKSFFEFVADKVSWLAGFIDKDSITKALSIGFDVASGAVSVVADFVDKVMSGIASAAGWVWDKAAGAFNFAKDVVMNVVGKGGSDATGPSFDPIATQAAVEWLAAYDWSTLASTIQTGVAGALDKITTWAHGSNGIISTIFLKVKDGQGQGDWQSAFGTESSKVRLGLVKALQAIQWGWSIGGVHKTVFDKVKGAQGGGDWQPAFGQEAQGMLKGLVGAVKAISWASVLDTVRTQVKPYDGGYAIGDAIGRGMYNGIRNWIADIVNAAVQAVRQAVNAAKSEAQVRSPSRKFFEIGAAMGEGLALGMRDASNLVAAAATAMTGAALVSPALAGGGTTTNTITINVTGSGDPQATADAVFSRLNRELGLRGPI